MRETTSEGDPRVQDALAELQQMIRGRWPSAAFSVSRGEDPEGVYLDATVDVEDSEEVLDVVIDRLLDMQVNERLPIHVVPLHPLRRELQEAARRANRISRLTGISPDEKGRTAQL